MLEIEVKVPVSDLSSVTARVNELEARFLGTKEQEDVYMAHPCRDFGITDEALRLRLDGDRQVITYKGPKLDSRSKTREEIEFSVPMDLMRTMLERLGFRSFVRVHKRRTEYLLNDVLICMDEVDGLGPFVELEFSGQDAETGLARIEEIKKMLGIVGNETRSYLELLIAQK